MTHDPVRALARVLQTRLRHHGTVERAATAGLVRGAWRHSTPAERAALDLGGHHRLPHLRGEPMTHDPVRALARVLQAALRHHGTVERAATAGLVRGAWRHSTPAERAALDPSGQGDLEAALRRLQEGATP